VAVWAISILIVITYLPTELTGLLDRRAAFSFISGKSKFSLLCDYRSFKLTAIRCFVDYLATFPESMAANPARQSIFGVNGTKAGWTGWCVLIASLSSVEESVGLSKRPTGAAKSAHHDATRQRRKAEEPLEPRDDHVKKRQESNFERRTDAATQGSALVSPRGPRTGAAGRGRLLTR
jgi:hypothetical protein